MPVEISVDLVSPTMLYGWARDDQQEAATLRLVVNNVHVVTLLADVFRSDLKVNGFANCNLGFQIPLQAYLSPGINTIEIFDSVSRQLLFSSLVSAALPGIQICEGRDGFFFIHKTEQNDVFDELQGNYQLTEFLRKKFDAAFAVRSAVFSSGKTDYYFCVLPDKAAVMGESYIDGFKLSGRRPLIEVSKIASTHIGHKSIIIDLVNSETSSPQIALGDLFYKTDSHMNNAGSKVMFDLIIDRLDYGIKSEVRRNYVSPTEKVKLRFRGDIADPGDPANSESVNDIAFEGNAFRILSRDIADSVLVTYSECVSGCNIRATIVGTSSSVKLAPYFFANFANVQHINSLNLNYELIRDFSPDVVIHLPGERLICNVPDDRVLLKSTSAN